MTISSDEEEECGSESSSQPATPKPQPVTQSGSEVTPSPGSSQKSTTSSDLSESPIIPSIPISSKVDNKPRVDKMEDEVTKRLSHRILICLPNIQISYFKSFSYKIISVNTETVKFCHKKCIAMQYLLCNTFPLTSL